MWVGADLMVKGMKRVRFFLVNVGVSTESFPLVTPPMGLMSIAAHVRARLPVDAMIVNQRLDNCTVDELARRAVDFGADVIGLSALSVHAGLLSLLAGKVRAVLPKALVMVGGPHVSGVRGRILEESCADIAVPGEGELATEMILRAWVEGGRQFGGIPGISWRDAAGEIVNNPGSTPLVSNLDDLPMPAYDLIDLPKYWKRRSLTPVHRHRYATLMSSRGCPHHCIYCHAIFGKRIRVHSHERVVDEMEYLQKNYGVQDFEILDDNFGFKAKRVLQICETIKERGVKTRMAFPNGLRADILDAETMDALIRMGMYHCSLALETGSPRLQKFTRKSMNISKLLDSAEYLSSRGVYTHLYCMLGFPTETEEDIRATIDIACKSACHGASFFTVMPYPGTALYDFVLQHHPDKIAGSRYEYLHHWGNQVNLSELSDERLAFYKSLAMWRFYITPRRITRLIRAHPQSWSLPFYIPVFLYRATKGWWSFGRGLSDLPDYSEGEA